MLSDICVHFVGPEGSHDKLLQKTRSTRTSHLFDRAHVVYQWLAVLRKINPLYENEPDLPPCVTFSDTLAGATDSLLNNSLVTEDEAAVERTEKARDDVAGIRKQSNIQIPEELLDVSSDDHALNETLLLDKCH